MTDDERAALRHWASTQPWHVFSAVAMARVNTDAVSIIRESTDVPIIIYDPELDSAVEAKKLNGAGRATAVCGDIISFRRELAIAAQHSRGDVMRLENTEAPHWLREDFNLVCEQLQETQNQNRRVISKLSDAWAKQMLSALPLITGCATIMQMEGALRGVPGIIVGAGPSLDKNIHLLKDIGERVAICAVNSSMGPLSRAMVKPHLCCVIDRADEVISNRLTQYRLDGIGLIAGPNVGPLVHSLPWKSRVIAPHVGSPGETWLCNLLGGRSIMTGGSCTTTAASALHVMGCNPIILIGQDCALDSGRMYAHGGEDVSLHDIGGGWCTRPGSTIKHRLKTATAWGSQGPVVSTGSLNTFRLWFEEAGRTFVETGRRIINATEGGASIDGWEELTLKETLSQLGRTRNPASRLASAFARSKGIKPATAREALRVELDGASGLAAIAQEAKDCAVQMSKLEKEFKARLSGLRLIGAAMTTRLAEAKAPTPLDRSILTYDTALTESSTGIATDIARALEAIGDNNGN